MEDKDLKTKLDKFVDENEVTCSGPDCLIKTDKSLVEVKLNKRVIVEDGRQLLI